ncbi:MAG TPA: hypothetical protein VF179_33180 [Thermoanaerobaculia bacterium]|nr:hypothetical protein [Thermoanaerobaculia bacterium]HYH76093.1 hypothetical protein [Arthrobacter sp.]
MTSRLHGCIPALLAAGICLATAPARAQNVPEPVGLKFTGPSEGFPPKVQGRTNVRPVPWTPIAGRLTEALDTQIRAAVVRNSRVRGLLGARYVHIDTAEVDPPKRQSGPGGPGGSGPLETLLTFYSYTGNSAVEVRARGLEVVAAAKRAGYQPPEVPEEVEAAARLARQDSRIRQLVQGLEADGIVTAAPQGSPGFGHRVLYITFSRPESLRPLVVAAVDLTTNKVLAAGKPKKGP